MNPGLSLGEKYYLMAQRINYSFILKAPADLSIWITTDLVIATGTATHKNERLSIKLTLVTVNCVRGSG